jgi:hypothetical protein
LAGAARSAGAAKAGDAFTGVRPADSLLTTPSGSLRKDGEPGRVRPIPVEIEERLRGLLEDGGPVARA